jgi:Arc/MetJ family transcription regulator
MMVMRSAPLRMTVTLDPDLLAEAGRALGTPTKAETIRAALAEAVRRRQLAAAVAHQGRIQLDLDQAALARLRAEA